MEYLTGIGLLLFIIVALIGPPRELWQAKKILFQWSELNILKRIIAVVATIILSPIVILWPMLIFAIYMGIFQEGPVQTWGISVIGMIGTTLLIFYIFGGLLLFFAKHK